MSKPKQSAALGFIFITIFIDVLGLGIIIPVLPKLLQVLGHIDVNKASEYIGWLTFVYASMQLIFASIMGNLSDRYGRRPILLISLFGFGLDYIVMAFAPTIAWLFVGRFIAGVCGASTSTATAYIADVSTGDKRAANFGLVGAASAIGLIVGIALGAFLFVINIRLPFIAAGGFAFANGLFGLFVLPESLAKENRRKFEWSRANPLLSLQRIYKKQPTLATLLSATAIVYIGQKAVEYLLSTFIYEKFNWTPASVGYLGLFIGLVLFGIQGGLIRYTVPKFGQQKNIIAGLIFYALGLLLIAIAGKGWMLYLCMIPYCLGGLSGPALQGLASEKVAKNEQGELQGAFAILNSISLIIGPLVFSYVFFFFTKKGSAVYYPGAPYLLGAVLMLISTFIAIKSFKRA
ncbi:TCR/Tet family MFS transporter [Mucilaginibacter gotjawali]|uniref:Tetracycline resistance protein, class C n=2 Tax=Mucilaginibacter gotjawali TaxID=1550579 RepID=A0A0X8X618_9SPHI|nr:TCR/Tet family MFS transporter [Mucilaginibacter gotjawali]MBB3053940.1 DHA1 family tetracycline resistance protein-like MFS transporter [Mucilaginibacter gotjawali]BAU54204.1 Tetracycline resistance protein, class C [Mucilaginibacter gotjawali]